MNLVELYDNLDFPRGGNTKTFTAIPVPGHPYFRIAVNLEGYPVLLLSIVNAEKENIVKNFRLKYLQLEQNVECKVTEGGIVSFQTFNVVTFTSNDRNLQEYFLKIAETLIKTLSNNPTKSQIVESIKSLVEVFRSLADSPTNTIHGLWTELFLIESSSNPKTLLNYWHNLPEEKFDFNSGTEKIEVKSNSKFERIHTFSSEQLNPPQGSQVLVASVFIRPHSNGKSIQQLIENIVNKINDDVVLVNKLYSTVLKTLGTSFEQSILIKFDHSIAKESIKFYSFQDIRKIEKIFIPNEVFEVHYKSDLSTVNEIIISNMKNKGVLYSGL